MQIVAKHSSNYIQCRSGAFGASYQCRKKATCWLESTSPTSPWYGARFSVCNEHREAFIGHENLGNWQFGGDYNN